MVIRVNRGFTAQFTAQQFDGSVGNNLVRVHIGLRARTRLPHNQREMVVQLVIGDFGRGGDNSIG